MGIIKVLFIFSSFLLHFASTLEWGGKIVFEDNFDGNSLDLNKWEYQEGCSNIYGGGNLQCYVRDNIRVQNGLLIITAKKERREDKDYTSGRLRQIGAGRAYGAYVVRARLARGDHLWPAIWLFRRDGECRYEEIDIAEYRGQAVEANQLAEAAHWGRSWDRLTSKETKVTVPWDLSTDFHEFAVLWLRNKIEWYVDDRKYFEVSLTDDAWKRNPDRVPCPGVGGPMPFSQNSNFILNLAVGGPFFRDFP